MYLVIFILNGIMEFSSFNTLVVFHFASGAIGLGVLIFYFNELYHNHLIKRQSKMKWLILFLFTGTFGFILYWKKYIW